MKQAVQSLLYYANTYRNASVRFYASKMQLNVDPDAAFIVLTKARSRIAGYFRILDPPSKKSKHSHNGAILIECRAISNVVTYAAEAEIHGVF